MQVTRYIHDLAPKTLLVRFLFIITIPVVIGQIIAVYIFYERHWYNVSDYTSSSVAREMALLVDRYEKGDKKTADLVSRFLKIDYSFKAHETLGKVKPSKVEELEIFQKQLSSNIKFPSRVYLSSEGRVIVEIQIKSGLLFFELSPKPLLNPTAYIFVLWIFLLTMLLLAVSLVFSKNQIRSIVELANAADDFRQGKKGGAQYKPSGASEIRRAGLAFIRMKERIERQITKRTQMLAMISHDLRTPLTRIKLQTAVMPHQEGLEEIDKDVENMEHMIASYLDFVRGEGGEVFQKLDIGLWFDRNMRYMKYASLEVEYLVTVSIFASIKPHAFARAIANILSNAAKYASKVKISISSNDDAVVISIEDNGKGINDADKSKVFKPFFRSDLSRNIDNTGSVGLGLAITKEIILGHDGLIVLEDGKDLGGLLVRIILPIIKS